jgi:nitrile hydratase subunit beta
VNGAADLGGMMGFGPVEPEPEGHPFHADWERRALALTLAVGAAGRWSIDASRHARESLSPAQYLTSSYYAIWVAALEKLLVAHGLVAADEIAQRRSRGPGEAVRVLRAADVPKVLAAGSRYERATGEPARSGWGSGSAPGTCTPPGTPGCRGTRAGGSGWWSGCTERMCCPTPTPTAPASSRSTSTPSGSTPASCGARPRTRPSR